jgi:hypothetical protein
MIQLMRKKSEPFFCLSRLIADVGSHHQENDNEQRGWFQQMTETKDCASSKKFGRK